MIRIKKSTKNPKELSYKELFAANQAHRTAVRRVLNSVKDRLMSKSFTHDADKFTDHDNMYHAIQTGQSAQWMNEHIANSRHHAIRLLEDVNLIDILELIADQVVVYSTRGLLNNPILLDPNDLQKAFDNTVKMMYEMIEVK